MKKAHELLLCREQKLILLMLNQICDVLTFLLDADLKCNTLNLICATNSRFILDKDSGLLL